MVPAAKFWRPRGRKGRCHRLSGLITPSLDEMCFVAAEMEREGFDLPLLIGGDDEPGSYGVKIHPNYGKGQTVYVTDASRAVGVVQRSSRPKRGRLYRHVRTEYGKVAEAHRRSEADKQRLPLAKARANAFKPIGQATRRRAPVLRHKSISYYDVANSSPISIGRRFSRPGKCAAAILRSSTTRNKRGGTPIVRRCASHARARRRGTLVRPESRHRFWPANSVGEDIHLYTGESRAETLATFFTCASTAAARRTSQSRACRFHCAGGDRQSGLYRRLRVTSGAREDKISKRSQGERRLWLDPRESSRRPPCGSLREPCMSAARDSGYVQTKV